MLDHTVGCGVVAVRVQVWGVSRARTARERDDGDCFYIVSPSSDSREIYKLEETDVCASTPLPPLPPLPLHPPPPSVPQLQR